MAESIGPQRKRVKKVVPDPNPLFAKWLQEWKDQAAASNSKTQHTYARALRSLKKYPLVLKTGKEAKMLEFFGDKICEMLDQRLAKYRRENPGFALHDDEEMSSASACGSQASGSSNQNVSQESSDSTSKKQPKTARTTSAKGGNTKGRRAYVPLPRSGPHAMLIALLQHPNQNGCTKADLIVAAQPLCDTSFTVPQGDSYYTAWSSMATLLSKGLVHREGRPHRHVLTDEGRELALKLAATSQGTSSDDPNLATNSSQSDDDVPPAPINRIVLQNFEVVLIVDCCEAISGPESRRKAEVERELRRMGVEHEVRRLSVGDFAWMAKEVGQHGPTCRELMVGPVVERKRTDDLASSIKDGRFREQKVRLRTCGAQNVVYLLEEFGSPGSSGLPESTLQQALASTQISDGFLIKVTRCQKDTIAYLTLVTSILRETYAGRTLYSCSREELLENPLPNHCITFQEFSSSSVKNKDLSVREMFGKHLLQLKGVSLEKATCILRAHPTPHRHVTLNYER
ncbi:crossover junction endonuclease MUS81-like [Ornithodoros turicata]|uniref:crossover junction endonuclease MUS81-like n=1 Tax=Ornithodoros turicata TaxID=34597 RepID=UPI003139DBF5